MALLPRVGKIARDEAYCALDAVGYAVIGLRYPKEVSLDDMGRSGQGFRL